MGGPESGLESMGWFFSHSQGESENNKGPIQAGRQKAKGGRQKAKGNRQFFCAIGKGEKAMGPRRPPIFLGGPLADKHK
jgi:hypothetical protein